VVTLNMKADHRLSGSLTAARRYNGRAVAVTLLVALAMFQLPALHHHIDGGLFSDDCPLARLACGVAGMLPKAPEEPRLRLLSPFGAVSSTAPVLIRSQLSSFGSRAPPTAT